MTERTRTNDLDWEDIRYFARMAVIGSLAGTARSFGVNHATVARHLASLEKSLGVSLFDRRPDGYHLTAAGRVLLEEAETMAAAAESISGRIGAAGRIAGLVRITATALLSEAVLIPGLAALSATHPDIDLEIIIESRLLSLARREADIAVRIGQPRDSDLVCRRVCELRFGFYGTPAWAARIAAGEAPRFVGFDTDLATTIGEARWLGERFPEARFPMRVSGHQAQAAAAHAGFGIALLPHALGKGLADLVPIDLGDLPPGRPVWLIMRPDLARQPRFRIVAEAIVAVFGATDGSGQPS